MLTIRNEQMRLLIRLMRDQFLDRLQPFCAAQWPAQTAQLGPRFRSFLNSSVDLAISYGIRRESEIARFVNLCFVWGPDFECRPQNEWAKRILTNPALDGKRKIDDLAYCTGLKLKVRQLNKRPPGV